MKKIIYTTQVFSPIDLYIQGILLKNIFFISGKIPINPINGLIPKGIYKKTFQVLENIRYILKKRNFYIKNIVKTTIFLKNFYNFNKMNLIYQKYFFKNSNILLELVYKYLNYLKM